MKKIALDVDGVLLNFMEAFDITVKKIVGDHVQVVPDINNITPYDLLSRAGIDENVKNSILQYMIDNGVYASLKPFEGVKEALQQIKEAGFKIYVVTALPESAQQMRLNNLKEMLDFVPDEIHCVGMGMSKADALKEISPDIFIDDRIEYLSSAPHVYHLAWVDQFEVQTNKNDMIDVQVHSLKEWVDNYMPTVVEELDNFYNNNNPLQIGLKLESAARRHSYYNDTEIAKKVKP